eukprot:TRINITY_DN636_c0_g1_i1.p1 TRINITY_DN636_c0_g1~~TRINITY_DN636_c0_g1_i1.p1  ORF type:complete len:713 (+),score=269.87 TRINITY_DN636_c0_g1_i1:43-2139(+)
MHPVLLVGAVLAVSPPAEWVAKEKTASLMYTMDTSFTSNWKALPTVGNGYVSTLVTNPAEYVAGVYNWEAKTQSSRATFPASTNIALEGASPAGYALDMQFGTAERIYSNGVLQRWYAHRVQKNLLVTEFIGGTGSDRYQDGAGRRPSVDCTHATDEDPGNCYMEYTKAGSSTSEMEVYTGTIDRREYPGSPLISFVVVRTAVDQPVELGGGVRRFLSVRVTSLDANSSTSNGMEEEAISMYKGAARDANLYATHTAEWTELTAAGMFVEGDHDLAQSINASFYGVLSALHKEVPWDTSPGGLSTNGYWGNVFWDSDTWIYPNALLFHHDLGRSQMQYRYNVREGARQNAEMQGWKGYQFPWQSGETGQEVCYNSIYEYQEIHISGDVAQAMWQMWRATHDKQLLADMVYPVLYNVSTFWASRVVQNRDGTYSINNVMCPDEDANGVNNSAYTNAVAKQTFVWTKLAAAILGKTTPAGWDEVEAKLVIPFDTTKQYHPEYEGYKEGMVKQADVVLMGYPLMFPMPHNVYFNDLNFYGNHTRNSVAMTWAIFTIGYRSIGYDDQAAKAFDATVRQNNPSGPFHTWGEYEENSGCPNFLTAAGGFLQSVWAGFGGVRLTDGALTITKPAPPSGGSDRLTLSKLYYLGCLLTVDIHPDTFSVVIDSCGAQAPSLYANQTALHVGTPVSYSTQQQISISARQ